MPEAAALPSEERVRELTADPKLTAEDAKRFGPVMFEFLKTRVPPDVVSRLEKALRG